MTCKVSVGLQGTVGLFAMRIFPPILYLKLMRARVYVVVDHCRTVTTNLRNFGESGGPACPLLTVSTLVLHNFLCWIPGIYF